MTEVITSQHDRPREPSGPGRGPRLRGPIVGLVAVIAVIAVTAVVGTMVVRSSDNAELVHLYELDGNLDDANGGPSLEATGGTVTPVGFVFEPGDGLTADVDLGESYTIEFRVRVDQSGHAIKLFDFSDRNSDAGLYVFEQSELIFWFSNGCGELHDESQGCPRPSEREPMAATPYQFEAGEWFTMRFTRDGETNALTAEIDGATQTWEIRYPPWSIPEGFVPEQVDRVDDLMDEAVQPLEQTPLHILLDDRVTGDETGSGELDYVKITIR